MGQVFRRETTFDKLFEEFAIDPDQVTIELEEDAAVEEEDAKKNEKKDKK